MIVQAFVCGKTGDLARQSSHQNDVISRCRVGVSVIEPVEERAYAGQVHTAIGRRIVFADHPSSCRGNRSAAFLLGWVCIALRGRNIDPLRGCVPTDADIEGFTRTVDAAAAMDTIAMPVTRPMMFFSFPLSPFCKTVTDSMQSSYCRAGVV